MGTTGQTGSIGQVGPTGQTGQIGQIGLIGQTGQIGQVGPTGSTGQIGQVGPTGQTGQVGQVGPTGQTGQVGQIGPTGQTGQVGQIGPTGQTGPIGQIGPTGPNGTVGPVVSSSLGFICVFGGDVTTSVVQRYLSYNGKYDDNTDVTQEGFYLPITCSLKAYSYGIESATSGGTLEIKKQGTTIYTLSSNNFVGLGGFIDSLNFSFVKGERCDIYTSNCGFGKSTFILYFF